MPEESKEQTTPSEQGTAQTEQGAAQSEQGDDFTKLNVKDILDKIGFGFGSQQFINILFLQTGASIFLLGLINGLRVVFGNLASFFLEKHENIKTSKRLISLSGIIFGFSFLIMTFGIFIRSAILFSIAILMGSVSVIVYGQARNLFKVSTGRVFLNEKIMKYSLIITAISLFIAAYLMDAFPASGEVTWNIFGRPFSVYGYLIVFEIAAVSFILAGYILSFVKKKESNAAQETKQETNESQLKHNFSFFVDNKMLLLLIIASMVVSVVQIVGYSYYGVFIFQKFNDVMFGGYLNVAMVFLISVFTSLIGYFITKINAREYKKFPILIFGVAMLAFMPFTYYFSQDLAFITFGTIIGVIGSSIIGVTSSLLTIELINYDKRQAYLSLVNLFSIPVFIIVVPIFALVAQIFGLTILFLTLAIISFLLLFVLLIGAFMLRRELA
jgi:MFS family permease